MKLFQILDPDGRPEVLISAPGDDIHESLIKIIEDEWREFYWNAEIISPDMFIELLNSKYPGNNFEKLFVHEINCYK